MLLNRIKFRLISTEDEALRVKHMKRFTIFNKNLVDDTAKYIETDYFTLSLIILYEPFTWTDINPYILMDQRFGIINLYNWKYIT